jgi:cysteine synthase B
VSGLVLRGPIVGTQVPPLSESILDTIGNTPMVELKRFSPKPDVRIFAKIEGANPTGSVKDRIALFMVEQAEREGRISPGQTLIEPTSGNTGISLAMVCKIKGYRFIAVMPENVSEERRQLLQAFGAEVVSTDGTRGSNGAIEVAQRMAADRPDYLMLYQYGNEANPRAHERTTAPEILEAVPDINVFVAGLGTGGTLMGVGRYLKRHDERIRVIAGEPNLGDVVQGLRNLDEGFVPPIFDPAVLDKKLLVGGEDSIRFTQELLWREGVFAGVSSGGALSVAVRVGRDMDRGNIVVLFADHGWKYLSTQLWSKGTAQAADDLGGQLLW